MRTVLGGNQKTLRRELPRTAAPGCQEAWTRGKRSAHAASSRAPDGIAMN